MTYSKLPLYVAALALMFCGFTPSAQAETPVLQAEKRVAYFSGGCFWCTEHDFEKLDGVETVVSGYMGGHIINPAYKQVSAGNSGHYEVVQVVYDLSVTNYQKLLSAFWRMHDPSDGTGSFCDRGQQYSSAIFYVGEEQRKLSEAAIAALNEAGKFERGIQTRLLEQTTFYKAEEYHQNYAKRNPLRYRYYRSRCGRDAFIKKHWKGDERIYR